MNIQEIQATLQQHRPRLAQQYHIKTLGLFGSYVRGDQTPDSDIDVLVDFEKPIGFDFINLQIDLEKVLGKKVDLVTPTALKPRLRSKILQEVIYT